MERSAPESSGAGVQRPSGAAPQPSPGGQQPPPGQYWQPPPGAAPPPGGYWQPPPGWSPAYGYPPPPAAPKATGPANDAAVASLCLSAAAGLLVLFTTGLASPLTLVLAILGIVFGRRGKRRVERGETDRHRDLAQAGFITGIVALVLSVLAILLWAAIVVAVVVAESASPGPGLDGLDSVRTAVETARRLV